MEKCIVVAQGLGVASFTRQICGTVVPRFIGAYGDGFSMAFIYYYGYHSQPNYLSRKQTPSKHPIAE